jgi:hypothetical protein
VTVAMSQYVETELGSRLELTSIKTSKSTLSNESMFVRSYATKRKHKVTRTADQNEIEDGINECFLVVLSNELTAVVRFRTLGRK